MVTNMIEVTISEAERRMEELLNRVERGETVLVFDGGKLSAELRPLTVDERHRLKSELPPLSED
jgi:antitoxin (DNA-binding transcriptional repressor) of toxin-antitoxin stability system